MRYLLLFLTIPVLSAAQDHLLISEVMIPATSEAEKAFIEIYNPLSNSVPLNQIYLANYNTYYEMVNEKYSSNAAHFMVRFPDVYLEAQEVLVVALNGQAYGDQYGKTADFEIISSTELTADLQELRIGDNPILEFSRGMIILFSWDGINDRVQDIDYLPWGITPFVSFWMDKSGVQIDGPDADSEVSTYQDDLSRSQQKAWAAPTGGLSLQRVSTEESEEVQADGNGISFHNEATENWQGSFSASDPSPGVFSENPGDGTGTATVFPDTVETTSISDFTLRIAGTEVYTLSEVEINLADEWSWSQSAEDVLLSGDGFSSASFNLVNNKITIQQAQITAQQFGFITLKNLTAPAQGGILRFTIRTAVENGSLTEIAAFPGVVVLSPLSIAEIQNNFSQYDGKVVTIKGVVTIGAGVTRKDHTDAYIQDQSGRGLNAFYYDRIFTELKRGNLLKITGTISEYEGTTQIGEFDIAVFSENNQIPEIKKMSTLQAGDISLEGSMIETAGIINDIFVVGGGTNITINDGSGDIQLRIWDISGVNVSAFNLGDTLGVRGVIDIYNKTAQLLVAYQEDVFPGQIEAKTEGSGLASVQPDSVSQSQTISLQFTLTGSVEDTITQMTLTIPNYWQWTSSASDVSLSEAFALANISVENKKITLSDFGLLKQETGVISISNLTAPSADTISVFSLKTAGKGGTPIEIKNSPRVVVGSGTNITTLSIAEARTLPVGTLVTVKGIVVIGIGPLRSDRTDVYIQDESGYGINIFDYDIDPLMDRGNFVLVKGALTEYQGKLEITEYTARLLKSNVTLPEPQSLTTYEASTTLYEGSYVQIRGVITGRFSSGGGTSIYVDDGSGECTVRIWDTANLNLDNLQINEYVLFKGIVGIYNNAGQILVGYQEDISRPSFEGSAVHLKVENKPFAPDKGEKIEIEFSAGAENSRVTLRIFDLGGRLVTTLVDGAGIPFLLKKEWNGRDHLNDLVPLGTYICHLEVLNEANGKRLQKFAPIVVGTVLK